MTTLDYNEIDNELHSVFDAAMESSHTIDPSVRKKLPDNCFAIVEKDENGNVKRSYPLKVPGDKAKTAELCSKAIQMFHYCKPERKGALAKAILTTIKGEKISITISEKSQIFKYVAPSSFPKTVTIKPSEKKK